MSWIKNFPSLLAISFSLIVCIIGVQQPTDFRTLCFYVSITIISFYLIGMLVRKIIVEIITEVVLQKRKKQQEQNEVQEKTHHTTLEQLDDDDFIPLETNELGEKGARIISHQMMES